MLYLASLAVLPWLAPFVSGHACLWSEAMWGYNVTAQSFPYDNRPVVPLMHLSRQEWWWHNHLDYPPPDNTFLDLPAGGTLHGEIACDKGATSQFASSQGGDVQAGDNPCPGSPTTAFHANNKENARGCALGIVYKSNPNDVKPEDFTIFTANHTCVWHRFTDFQIPAGLPDCPEGGCICSFNWIHAPDSGAQQIYFNAYRCRVTNAQSNRQLATPRLARRCGPNPDGKDFTPSPWNCTYGAKQGIYWLQNEGNTFWEGEHDPPYYNDHYGFRDGAQNDIFRDSDLPVFNDRGEHSGYTTLGGSTATTANIVFPTVSSWPTTPPDQPSGPSNSGSSNSSNNDPPPAPPTSSSHGHIATDVAQAPDPKPTNTTDATPESETKSAEPSSAPPTTSVEATYSSAAATSAYTSTNSAPSAKASVKCRKRNSTDTQKVKRKSKKRALRSHERMSKRHDALMF